MTLTFTGDDPSAGVTLSQAMELYRDVASEVFAAIRRIKNGEWDPKGATHVVKEMRAFFELVLEERSRIEKQRKADEGAVNGYALDFEAARDEIGRRLARLRDAGGG